MKLNLKSVYWMLQCHLCPHAEIEYVGFSRVHIHIRVFTSFLLEIADGALEKVSKKPTKVFNDIILFSLKSFQFVVKWKYYYTQH